VRVYEPGVAEAGRSSDRGVAVRRDPDRGSTIWHERQLRFGDAEPGARRAHGLAAEQPPDHVQLSLEQLRPLSSGHLRDTERRVLDRAVAETHPQHKIFVRYRRESRRVLGDLHRVQQGEEHDRRTDGESLRGGRHTREQRHALEHLERRREEVLARPHRREAQRPGQLDLLEMFAYRGGG
jgi:hypothetical protein